MLIIFRKIILILIILNLSNNTQALSEINYNCTGINLKNEFLFEEKQLELRPGDYDILIKRKGKANSRIKLNISDKSQNRVFKIVCSESVCKINRTSR